MYGRKKGIVTLKLKSIQSKTFKSFIRLPSKFDEKNQFRYFYTFGETYIWCTEIVNLMKIDYLRFFNGFQTIETKVKFFSEFFEFALKTTSLFSVSSFTANSLVLN